MKVEKVLEVKGRAVHTVRPDQTVVEAVAALDAHHIGALVVSADGATPEGILSERDIVRALPARAGAIMDAPVEALMSTPVTTCTREDSIAHVMELMTEHRSRHLPVMEHGRLCGLISIGDVVKHRLAELKDEAETLRDYIGAR